MKQKQIRMEEQELNGVDFDGVQLIFTGEGSVVSNNCVFRNCTFIFEGPAANTLNFLAAVYQVKGGDKLVEGIFEQIRSGKFDGQYTLQ